MNLNDLQKQAVNGWPEDMYVVHEYSFGFECIGEVVLSHEHTELIWLQYKEAREKLQRDSI